MLIKSHSFITIKLQANSSYYSMHPFSSEAHQNFEPNYEALQVEYCWNHWYFSPSSLRKSYAPKKKKIKCQWWIRRIHRWTSRDACSLDWQFWLIVDMVNALSVTGSPTTASEGSLNENRSMSETKCTLYLRFCVVVSFFPFIRLLLISVNNVTAWCQRE